MLQVDGDVAVSAFGAALVDSAVTTAPTAPYVVSVSTLFELDGSLYLKLLFKSRNNANFAASIRLVALIGLKT